LLVENKRGNAYTNVLPTEYDQVAVGQYEFDVDGSPTFKLVWYERAENSALYDSDGAYTANGVAPPAGTLLLACTVGTNCHVAPINMHTIIVEHAADLCGGTCGETRLQFTMKGAPTGFFIDPDTGELLGAPVAATAKGQATLTSLWVVDESGFETFVEVIAITVMQPATFALAIVGEGSRTRTGIAYIDPLVLLAAGSCFVGDSYQIAPLQLDVDATVVSKGSAADITYTLVGAPESWFVSADTGIIFGRFTTPGTLFGFDGNINSRSAIEIQAFLRLNCCHACDQW
jgi:hypothetical protein